MLRSAIIWRTRDVRLRSVQPSPCIRRPSTRTWVLAVGPVGGRVDQPCHQAIMPPPLHPTVTVVCVTANISAVGPGPMHMKEPWRRPFPSPTTCTPPRVKLEPRLSSNAAGVVADLPTSSVSSRRFSLRYAFEAACYRPRGRCSRDLSTHLDGSASPLVFRFHFWSKSVSAASDFNAAHWWWAFDTLTLRADTPHPHQG